MTLDHASAVAAPKSDPVFLHVKAGMTVIVTDTDGAWRMGLSDAGRFWIYSCTLSVGGSVGAAGFVGIGPFSNEPVPIIGSQAEFGNRTMGCKVQ